MVVRKDYPSWMDAAPGWLYVTEKHSSKLFNMIDKQPCSDWLRAPTAHLWSRLTLWLPSFLWQASPLSDAPKRRAERDTISGEFFRRMLTQCSSRKDEKLPSSLRASKRGDVESIWFPVILYRAKTSHYCYFITWYPLFLTLFCFPVLVAIIPRLQSNTEQHATTYCQENDAVSLHLSTATAGLGQKF